VLLGGRQESSAAQTSATDACHTLLLCQDKDEEDEDLEHGKAHDDMWALDTKTYKVWLREALLSVPWLQCRGRMPTRWTPARLHAVPPPCTPRNTHAHTHTHTHTRACSGSV
jgi:hypothetical protein